MVQFLHMDKQDLVKHTQFKDQHLLLRQEKSKLFQILILVAHSLKEEASCNGHLSTYFNAWKMSVQKLKRMVQRSNTWLKLLI